MEILTDLHVLRSAEYENHIFSVWSVDGCRNESNCPHVRPGTVGGLPSVGAFGLCVCVSLVCICYQHNSRTNYSRSFKLGILHLYHVQMLLETFYKDQSKTLCTGGHKRILIHYGLLTEFRVSEFSYV